MVGQLLVQDALEVRRAHAVGHVAVRGVAQEEFAFSCNGILDVLLAVNVLLEGEGVWRAVCVCCNSWLFTPANDDPCG